MNISGSYLLCWLCLSYLLCWLCLSHFLCTWLCLSYFVTLVVVCHICYVGCVCHICYVGCVCHICYVGCVCHICYVGCVCHICYIGCVCQNYEDRTAGCTEDTFGMTPLHHACMGASQRCVYLLLQKDYPPNLADTVGYITIRDVIHITSLIITIITHWSLATSDSQASLRVTRCE